MVQNSGSLTGTAMMSKETTASDLEGVGAASGLEEAAAGSDILRQKDRCWLAEIKHYQS